MTLSVDLQQEYSKRLSEMKVLTNLYLENKDKDDPIPSVIVKNMYTYLYANFEGYVKNTLSLYIEALENLQLKCEDVRVELIISSFEQNFKDLENGQKKHPTLGPKFPDDSGFHKHWRRSNFLDQFPDVKAAKLSLDSEKLIVMESNLTPDVLRKLLFKSGLNLDQFKFDDASIHKLLGLRNSIAHSGIIGGFNKDVLNFANYEILEKAIFNLMENIRLSLEEAFSKESFRKL